MKLRTANGLSRVKRLPCEVGKAEEKSGRQEKALGPGYVGPHLPPHAAPLSRVILEPGRGRISPLAMPHVSSAHFTVLLREAMR